MGRPRKLNYTEVRLLYGQLGSYRAVAKELGCAEPSVRRIIDPKVREHQAQYQRNHKPYVGTCPDCNGPASNRYPSSSQSICRDCRSKRLATSVRPDALRCSCCRLWLPDDSFPTQAGRKQRRGRHGICTPCGNVMKRDWRATNAERERAKDRERKRRLRATS